LFVVVINFEKIGVLFRGLAGNIMGDQCAPSSRAPQDRIMAAGCETLLQYIRGLVIPSVPGDATDAALLGRFISETDKRAFTALVDRHGPLVFHVCQRILGNADDAEDALQAVFLVLARKAATVHPREALTAWLYGVARRVALKARSGRTRRPLVETRLPPVPLADPRADPLAELSARELLTIIDQEIQRLPEVYRLPVILCCLEGRSLEETSRQLGWTRGSVKGRLERGRARLHARLKRRGLTLPAALVTAALSLRAASAAVVARLTARTVRDALFFGTRQTTTAEPASPGSAALAAEIVKGMAWAKLHVAGAILLAMALVVTGFVMLVAALSPRTTARQVPWSPLPLAESAALSPSVASVTNQVPSDPGNALFEVSGRVLDPRGQALGGARLYVGYSARRYVPNRQLRQVAYPLRATSRSDGRFRFTFARSELDARWLDDARPAVVAVAAGYGPDWAEIREGAENDELSLKLVEDLAVNGRILDQNRRPIAGAKICVLDVRADSEEGVTRFLRGETTPSYSRRWLGSFPEQPPDAMTDADGRFRVGGLGRDRIAFFGLVGPSLRDASFMAISRPVATSPNARRVNLATFEHVASPSQPIRGVVRDRATGTPVAGVRMFALLDSPPAFTDDNGCFEILGCPKRPQGYVIMAQPQAGQPYFTGKIDLSDRPGFDPLAVDLDLVGGISISGRVTNQVTSKPPRAALVEYYPLFPNPHSSRLTYCLAMPASSAVVRSDGSYSLVVLPGPGVVCVAASPQDSYAVARVDDSELADLFHDGLNHGGDQGLHTAFGADRARILGINRFSALALINPSETAQIPALDLTLQPAGTVQGNLVDPAGAPLTGVEVVGLSALPDEEMLNSDSFTVTRLNPRRSRDLFFHHPGKELGRVVTIPGDHKGPLTVQLDPCGSVVGRLVNQRGNPMPGITVWLRGGRGLEIMSQTGRDGRFRGSLLPGQSYSLRIQGSWPLARDPGPVEVSSGRSTDVGDLPVLD
jgi:RNA polymerase sigma factor (sigma-70 family)